MAGLFCFQMSGNYRFLLVSPVKNSYPVVTQDGRETEKESGGLDACKRYLP